MDFGFEKPNLESKSVKFLDSPPAKGKTRYEIIEVDFYRVRTPFVVGAWILFAGLAQIGK